jgi:IS1 family transposase
MSKLSLDRTVSKGSPKQRALLVFNHITDINSGGKGLLSEAEYNSVYNSFKTDQEVKVYNKFRAIYTATTTFMGTMAQYRFMYMVALERLDKFIIMYKNNVDTQDLLNLMLELMPDKKTRAKALGIAKDFSDGLTSKIIKETKENLIEIKNSTLLEHIEASREEVVYTQRLLKTSIKAIKDYLAETGFNVKIFSAYVKETEAWARGDSDKGITANLSSLLEGEGPERLKKLSAKYRTELKFEEVEIDKEAYDHLRKTVLVNEGS